MNPIHQLTEATFEEAIAQPGILVIDFWAAWCPPCRAMAPQLARVAELRPQYRFAKVDVDAEPELTARFRVMSIPTLLVLSDGEPVGQQTGVIAAEQLAGALDRIAHARTEVAA